MSGSFKYCNDNNMVSEKVRESRRKGVDGGRGG